MASQPSLSVRDMRKMIGRNTDRHYNNSISSNPISLKDHTHMPTGVCVLKTVWQLFENPCSMLFLAYILQVFALKIVIPQYYISVQY